MITFAIIAVIVLIIVFLLVLCAEKGFERTNYYKNNYTDTEKLQGTGVVDYVNTGSTFALYGIDYESCNVKGLNLALKPQSLYMDFELLKHFEYRFHRGTTVLITISDLAFLNKGYSDVKVNDRYYKVLNRNEIKDYNLFKALRAKCFPVLYHWKNFLRFHWDVRLDKDMLLEVNENDIEAIEADAIKKCEAWKKEFNLSDLNNPSQAKYYSAELQYTTGIVSDMIRWCKYRGFNPVLVNLPVTNVLIDQFSTEFLHAFYYNSVEHVCSQNVPFIDLQDIGKLGDYLLYLDSCRLNKKGREVVTKTLLRELDKRSVSYE